MTTIELDRPVKKSENCSAGTALTVRPQPRYAPALPSRIATRVPQRDWGHFPERRRVYNPWEHKVTTCIGAICQDGSGERIIMCSDTRVGIEGFASADVGVKLHIPHQGIAAMIAGTIARGRELLSVYGKHMAEGTALTALTVRDEMKVPPQIQKRKLIEEYLANTWAVSYGEYLDGKLGNLPPDVLSDIAKTVSGINLQCSLILGLFLGKTPFLFTVDESGAVLQADAFACIGSGWSIAQANMYRRRYSHRFRLGDAAYVVYESKRLSEVDPSVGPGTVLGVFSTDDMCLITHEGRKRLDEEMSKQCPSTLRKVEMPDTFFLSSKKNMASSEHEEKAVSQPSAGSTGQEKTEDGV